MTAYEVLRRQTHQEAKLSNRALASVAGKLCQNLEEAGAKLKEKEKLSQDLEEAGAKLKEKEKLSQDLEEAGAKLMERDKKIDRLKDENSHLRQAFKELLCFVFSHGS